MDKAIAPSRAPEWDADNWSDAVDADDFKSLTREQAQEWRQRQPQWSPWRVVMWQCLLSATAAGLAAVFWQQPALVWSVAYGGLSVALPTALMAYGLTSSALSRWMAGRQAKEAQASLAVVFFWEGIKVLMVLAMLWSAPRWIPNLSWLGMTAGLVVALKAYWVVFYRSRRHERQSK